MCFTLVLWHLSMFYVCCGNPWDRLDIVQDQLRVLSLLPLLYDLQLSLSICPYRTGGRRLIACFLTLRDRGLSASRNHSASAQLHLHLYHTVQNTFVNSETTVVLLISFGSIQQRAYPRRRPPAQRSRLLVIVSDREQQICPASTSPHA